MSHRYATIEDTIGFGFVSNDTSGSGVDGTTPLYDVRLVGATASDIPIHSGTPDLLTHANYGPGAYEVAVPATAANGFLAGNEYSVFVTLTADGQTPGACLGSFTLGPAPADVIQVSGDATAADNLELDYDGTGYAKANSTIGTCTTNTDAITDIINITPLIPAAIDLGDTATWQLGFMVLNGLGDLASQAEIEPGQISILRKAAGATTWTGVVGPVVCLDDAGLIYYNEVFDSGSGYAAGDSIQIQFFNQKVTVGATDYEISNVNGRFFYTYIRDAEQTGDSFARLAAPAGASVSADIAAVKAAVDGMLTTAMTEAYNMDGSAPTVAEALHLMIAYLTERSVSGTTVTAKQLDDSTTAATFTLDDATNPTSVTRAT